MGKALEQQAREEADLEVPTKEVKVPKTRANSVVRLKLSGLSFAQIAEIEELTNATVARQIFEAAVGATVDEKSLEQARRLHGARLDRLLQAAWTRSINTNDVEQLAFMRTTLSIIDRQMDLDGSRAPKRLEVSSPSAEEKEEFVRQLIRQNDKGDAQAEEENIIDAEVVGDDDDE